MKLCYTDSEVLLSVTVFNLFVCLFLVFRSCGSSVRMDPGHGRKKDLLLKGVSVLCLLLAQCSAVDPSASSIQAWPAWVDDVDGEAVLYC